MKYVLALATCASLSLAAMVDLSQIPRGNTKNVVPGAYMVEIDPHTIGVSSIIGKRSLPPHAHLYAHMHKRDISWTTTREFEGDLYTGVSVKLNVSSVYPVMLLLSSFTERRGPRPTGWYQRRHWNPPYCGAPTTRATIQTHGYRPKRSYYSRRHPVHTYHVRR